MHKHIMSFLLFSIMSFVSGAMLASDNGDRSDGKSGDSLISAGDRAVKAMSLGDLMGLLLDNKLFDRTPKEPSASGSAQPLPAGTPSAATGDQCIVMIMSGAEGESFLDGLGQEGWGVSVLSSSSTVSESAQSSPASATPAPTGQQAASKE